MLKLEKQNEDEHVKEEDSGSGKARRRAPQDGSVGGPRPQLCRLRSWAP